MYGILIIGILLSMGLVLIRAIKGPSVFDRILAVNAFGTLTVILICVHGFLTGRPDFLDLALVYALISFIGTIAVSKYVTFSNIKDPIRHDFSGDI